MRKVGKTPLAVVVFILVATIVAAFAASSSATSSKPAASKDLVAFVMTSTNVYGANQIKGMKQEAARLGYKIKVYEHMFSQPQQDQQVQQYLATGAKPAAVIYWPWIAASGVNSARLLSQRAPVIQMTQEPFPKAWPYVKAYAGANQVLIGETAGKMLMDARAAAKKAGAKFKSKNGSLLVFQHPQGEFTGTARWAGLTKVTKGAPFKTIHTEYGANDPDTGYKLGSQVIPKYKGQFDFVYVSNQQAANGIIRAMKENGIKPGKDVWIVSSDCSGSLTAVKTGETFGTGLQPAAIEGTVAVRTAIQFLTTGKVKPGKYQYPATKSPPPFNAKVVPSKYNYMPHAPAEGPAGIKSARVWGYTADQICAAG
ncbi:MAG: substrate-binding domain-containing protein [Gaiellales bacterium]